MADFGPFSVSPEKIGLLGGTNFGAVVSRLLAMETARAGLAGSALETTYKENVGDGGVDTGLRRATVTRWIPAGDSAWQFKAGDLAPAKCKKELRDATEALAILRAGGKYRLVLGATRTAPMIASRRKALREEARSLKIDIEDDTFEVITADNLATWVEEHPALAVDPLLGGIGTSGLTFEHWSQSIASTRTVWATSKKRDAIIGGLREAITSGAQRDIRVEGVSGVGKTRLVLEALRGQEYESIVVYIPSADQFYAPLLNHLATDGRTAIVVVDECDRKQHEVYASALTPASTTRLITIGEPSSVVFRSPAIELSGIDDEAMSALLALNVPELPPEARRVVVEVASGNVDYALQAAEAVGRNVTSAGTIITVKDVKAFITDELPKGDLFVASAALALFSRFGHDREVSAELKTIAAGLGLRESDLRNAARELQDSDLLSQQGRYRSVGPYPLAVLLAKAGWDELGDRIVTGLMPTLDPDLLERLFRRAADIGEIESASDIVSNLLHPSSTLVSLAASDVGKRLLSHLAVIAPVTVSDHLAALLDKATDDEIVEHDSIRRELVSALGKLAWHSQTFQRAADSLLRLATVETEQWSNNATGTWVDLFGTSLPATAASPESRIEYLKSVALSTDARVRVLVVNAGAHAFDLYGPILVLSELQGGRVVEPRGSAFGAQLVEYVNSAIDMLRVLADDPEGAVSEMALKALIGSLPSLLDIEPIRRHLGTVYSTLPPEGLRAVRAEIASMRALYDTAEEARARRPAIDELDAMLPSASASDELWVLAHSHAWDFEGDQLLDKLRTSIGGLDDPRQALLALVAMPEALEAAYEVGRALAELADDSVLPSIETAIDTPNFPALIGYLQGRVDAGDVDAFDRFIDSAQLTDGQALNVTVRGPLTPRAKERVQSLIDTATVAVAAQALVGWDIDEGEAVAYLKAWAPRIETQNDYDAVLYFVTLQSHRLGDDLAGLDAVLLPLVTRRIDFPDVGHHHSRWEKFAVRAAEQSPGEVVGVYADLIGAGALRVFSVPPEKRALEVIVRNGGPAAWTKLIDRLKTDGGRLSFATGGWLANATELETARQWVASDVARARVLASTATIGDTEVSPIAQYLLDEFGTDDKVASALFSEYSSGSWTGEYSDRLTRQIAQLEGWTAREGESKAVKSWARKVIAALTEERRKALAQEAEETW